MNGLLLNSATDRPSLDRCLGKSFVKKRPEGRAGRAALGRGGQLDAPDPPTGAPPRLRGRPGLGRGHFRSKSRKAEVAAGRPAGCTGVCGLAPAAESRPPGRPARTLLARAWAFKPGCRPLAVVVANGGLAKPRFPPPLYTHTRFALSSSPRFSAYFRVHPGGLAGRAGRQAAPLRRRAASYPRG